MKVNKQGHFMIRNDYLSNLIASDVNDYEDILHEFCYDAAEIYYRQGLYKEAEERA